MANRHVPHLATICASNSGAAAIGTIVGTLADPEVVRCVAGAGFDWVFVDGEHGWLDDRTIRSFCATAHDVNLPVLFRVASVDRQSISRALDLGADGLILPQVNDVATVERAVSWAQYPPLGRRGFGLGQAHLGYPAEDGTSAYGSATMGEVTEVENARIMIVVQIETLGALEDVAAIVAVAGVDAVLVGPADLSIALGIAGHMDDPLLGEAMERVVRACEGTSVIPGAHGSSPALARRWIDAGFRLVSCSSDLSVLGSGLRLIREHLL